MSKMNDDERKAHAVMTALNTIWDDFDIGDAETFMRALVPLGYLVTKL